MQVGKIKIWKCVDVRAFWLFKDSQLKSRLVTRKGLSCWVWIPDGAPLRRQNCVECIQNPTWRGGGGRGGGGRKFLLCTVRALTCWEDFHTVHYRHTLPASIHAHFLKSFIIHRFSAAPKNSESWTEAPALRSDPGVQAHRNLTESIKGGRLAPQRRRLKDVLHARLVACS